MYPAKINHLRDISRAITSFHQKKTTKNSGAQILGEAARYWIELNMDYLIKNGSDEYRSNIKKCIKYEGAKFAEFGLNKALEDEMSRVIFTFKDRDEIFASGVMTHLLKKV